LRSGHVKTRRSPARSSNGDSPPNRNLRATVSIKIEGESLVKKKSKSNQAPKKKKSKQRGKTRYLRLFVGWFDEWFRWLLGLARPPTLARLM
jgi:hypothetical protein